MTTTFDDMSIIRRYINATDGFDHASKRQDALNQRKSKKRGNRLAFYFYAVDLLQPEYDSYVTPTTAKLMDNLFDTIKGICKPNQQ